MTMPGRTGASRAPRSRTALALVGVAVILLALGAMVFQSPPNEVPSLQADLASAAAQVGDGGRIPLASVAPFAWDRVYIFGAYTPLEAVADGLGFDWVPLSRFDRWLWGDSFMPNDGFALVVFVRGEREVTGYRVVSPYREPALYMNVDFVALPRDAAAFEVAAGEGGSFWELTLATP